MKTTTWNLNQKHMLTLELPPTPGTYTRPQGVLRGGAVPPGGRHARRRPRPAAPGPGPGPRPRLAAALRRAHGAAVRQDVLGPARRGNPAAPTARLSAGAATWGSGGGNPFFSTEFYFPGEWWAGRGLRAKVSGR